MLPKKLLLLVLSGVLLVGATACSSSARVGTRSHHVSLGGSVQ